jgi:hypothetical protein
MHKALGSNPQYHKKRKKKKKEKEKKAKQKMLNSQNNLDLKQTNKKNPTGPTLKLTL